MWIQYHYIVFVEAGCTVAHLWVKELQGTEWLACLLLIISSVGGRNYILCVLGLTMSSLPTYIVVLDLVIKFFGCVGVANTSATS